MFDWLALSLVSAFFLGVYDLSKKASVNGNAVLPVIFLGCVVMAAAWAVPLGVSLSGNATALPELLRVDALDARDHLLLLLKSTLVAGSWILSYFALKHLPVSLASPIRATGPVWTLAGALLILSERPTPLQGLGIGVTIAAFIGLSLAGRRDGIHFHRDKWVFLMLGGTLLGSASALYDKFLLGHIGMTAATVQAWFSVYLVVVLTPVIIGWKRGWWPRGPFRWRWSIVLIGLFLLAADYAYFAALRDPDALVALVSCLRRANVLVAFVGGLWLFRERNGRAKLPAILALLTGIILIALG